MKVNFKKIIYEGKFRKYKVMNVNFEKINLWR